MSTNVSCTFQVSGVDQLIWSIWYVVSEINFNLIYKFVIKAQNNWRNESNPSEEDSFCDNKYDVSTIVLF